jgi:hypothetical protein
MAVPILAASLYAFRALPLDQAFAIAGLGTLLTGYYVNWHDATLALPAAAMTARSRQGSAIVLAVAIVVGIPLWWDAFRPVLNLVLLAFWLVCTAEAFRARTSPAEDEPSPSPKGLAPAIAPAQR